MKHEAHLTGDSVRYRIRVIDDINDAGDPTEGEVIHEGIATTRTAGGQSIIISPNEVAANYLGGELSAMRFGWHSQLLGRIFCLDYWNTDGRWIAQTYWCLYGDWSYDYDFNIEAMGLSHPIRAIATPNQWLVASVIDWDDQRQVNFLLIYADGTEQEITQDLFRAADFNSDFNADFAISAGEYNVAGYAALYLGAYAGLVKVQVVYPAATDIILAEYKVAEHACKRYALYYRNALTEGWELRLNNLTDADAARMHHLIGSAEVYLCDLIADTLTPLVLTDTECVDRTFANGRKRIDWKLAATTAQVMRRE